MSASSTNASSLPQANSPTKYQSWYDDQVEEYTAWGSPHSVMSFLSEYFIQTLFDSANHFTFKGMEEPLCSSLIAITPEKFAQIKDKLLLADGCATYIIKLCCTSDRMDVLAWVIKQDKHAINDIVNTIWDAVGNNDAFVVAMENIPFEKMGLFHSCWLSVGPRNMALCKKITAAEVARTKAFNEDAVEVARVVEETPKTEDTPLRKSLKEAVDLCIAQNRREHFLLLWNTGLIDLDWCIGFLCENFAISDQVISHPTFDIKKHHRVIVTAAKHGQTSKIIKLLKLIKHKVGQCITDFTPEIEKSLTRAMIAVIDNCENTDCPDSSERVCCPNDCLNALIEFGHGSVDEVLAEDLSNATEQDFIALIAHPKFSIHANPKMFVHAANFESGKLMRHLTAMVNK